MKRKLTVLTAILMTFLCLSGTVYAEQAAETSYYTQLSELAGKRIGVGSGKILDKIGLAQWPDAEILYYSSSADQIIALQQGKVDAFLDDEPVARQIVATIPGLRILDERLMEDRYGFAFQKTEQGDRLRDEFNEFLRTAMDGKLMESLDEIWFGADESVKIVEPADSLPAINGTVRFACNMESAPFNYLHNGQPVGTEVDLITRFCKEMGYGLQIVTASFDALLPGLVTDRYDAVASSISITEERAQSVHFSDAFYYGGAVAVVLDEPDGPSDAAIASSRVGSITGSVGETYCLEHYTDAEYLSFPSLSDLMLALKSGKVQYGACGILDEANFAKSDPGYRIAQYKLITAQCSIAVAKGNEELLLALNDLLDRYEQDGTLARLRANWVRTDGSEYVTEDIPEVADGPVLRVAFCSGFEPICFVKDGEITGHDIELMRHLAYDMGMRAVFTDLSISGVLASVEAGMADVAICGITATEERAQKMDFTRGYFEDELVLVTYIETDQETDKGFLASIGDSFRRNFLTESRWKMIVSGVGVTVLLSLCAGIVGIAIGFGLCLMRMNRHRAVNAIASIATRLLQGTPIVVLLMIMYYVVFGKSGLNGISVAVIAFGLNFGAYASEIMLSGINAVDNGQREAAAAIGFSPARTFLKIVFPQAAKLFLPVLKGEYISLVKMTSVVGYVAVQDLTKVSDIIRSRTYEAFFPLIVTAVLYFLLSYGLSSLLRLIEVRVDPKRRARALKGVEWK